MLFALCTITIFLLILSVLNVICVLCFVAWKVNQQMD